MRLVFAVPKTTVQRPIYMYPCSSSAYEGHDMMPRLQVVMFPADGNGRLANSRNWWKIVIAASTHICHRISLRVEPIVSQYAMSILQLARCNLLNTNQ